MAAASDKAAWPEKTEAPGKTGTPHENVATEKAALPDKTEAGRTSSGRNDGAAVSRVALPPVIQRPASEGSLSCEELRAVGLCPENEPKSRMEWAYRDLQIAFHTAVEHSDLLQDQLQQKNQDLMAEIVQRQSAESKLQRMMDLVSREKSDLESMVQILLEHGDASAREGEEARTDSLTGIANRRRFDEALTHEWQRHSRSGGPLSVILSDVDHFKLYNDHYGHQAGDDCLRAVAQAIRNACQRPTDVVARYGGEEFAVILAETDEDGARYVAERVREAVVNASLPHAYSPVGATVTLSLGVATRRPQTGRPDNSRLMMEEADRRLYLAKRNGRNQVCDQD